MDLDRARTFLEIVHSGSFLKAAERLHVTQTTVSARIRTLEDELGRKLFVRNRNGAKLTAAGAEFERFAQMFVQVWERARHQLALPPERDGIVSLGAEPSLWEPLLVDWMSAMKTEAPQFVVRGHIGTPNQLMDELRNGVLDVALLYSPSLDPGFKVELLVEDQLVLVRSTENGPDRRGPEEYIHVDWGPAFTAQHHARSPYSGEPGTYVNFGPLGLSYLRKTGGVGYFRHSTVAPLIAEQQLEIVSDAPRFTYPAYAVFPEDVEQRSELRVALKMLRRILASTA